MPVYLRALAVATLFVSLVFVFVPSRLMAWTGVVAPAEIGPREVAGMAVTAAGAALGLWTVLAFAVVGKGTPAPFDPPRRLVVRGPYRYVRNPMYVGAGIALLGAASFFRSWAIAAYCGLLLGASHVFIVRYEEPTLRRAFGADYGEYCRAVRRWLPGRPAPPR